MGDKELLGWLTQARVLIVAGKGGVGKTTITAALALCGARAGLDTLIVELEGRSTLARMFGSSESLGYEELLLWSSKDSHLSSRPTGRVRARTITPDEALMEYLDDHGMRRVSKRLLSTGALDIVSTAIPGIKDILVLGKVKQLERSGTAELIVLDAPATGHAKSFLTTASGLLQAARSGPVRSQAAEVLEMLTDPKRCQILLVTIPEEMPVTEVVETGYALEDGVGVALGAVMVNACYPHIELLEVPPKQAAHEAGIHLPRKAASVLEQAAAFRLGREAAQQAELARLHSELPLPQVVLPYVFSAQIAKDELQMIASALGPQLSRLWTERSNNQR
jgi:anion-transporting  ArsA/GET3 family ATPase